MELVEPDPMKPLNVDLPVQFSPRMLKRKSSETSSKIKERENNNSSKNSSTLRKTALEDPTALLITNNTDGIDYDEVNNIKKITFEELLRIREEPIVFDELTLKLTGKKKFSLTATDLCRQTVKKHRTMFKRNSSKQVSIKSSKNSSPLKALGALIALREKINQADH